MIINCANPKAQYSSYKDEIDLAIKRVLDSGWYILGKEVESFEIEFANYNKSNYSIGVGSGTEALHLSLRALNIKSGDEVITTAHTAVATASAIVLSGAKPIFVDIEKHNFNIDPNLIEDAITENTKAIMPVHIYGHPCDMEPIMGIAKKHGLKVIEDCAQAHGATISGKRVGTFGDLGCYSFYPTKNLGAIGDGGAIVTDDRKLAKKVKLLREYGWEQRYISTKNGWNSRLDEVQAAIHRIKLNHLDDDNNKRIERANKYILNLKDSPIDLPISKKSINHVYHLFVIKVKSRDDLKEYLNNQGIQTTIQYPIPIHKQKYYNKIVSNISLPITEQYANKILSLPIYPELEIESVDNVCDIIKNYYEI